MVRIVERRKPSQDKGFRAFLLVSESGFLGLITRRAAFDAKADPVGRSGSGSSCRPLDQPLAGVFLGAPRRARASGRPYAMAYQTMTCGIMQRMLLHH